MEEDKKKTIWQEEFEPKIEIIKQKTNNGMNWFQANDVENYNKSFEKLKNAKNNYKQNHNRFTFWLLKWLWLPLSIVSLGFPFYFAFKKYKKLKENKLNLESIIEKSKQEKLKSHNDLANNINFYDYVKEMYELLNYEEKGPITTGLVNSLSRQSFFDLNSDYFKNPDSTSWGIFDKNKIIINKALQTHHLVNRVYSGSTSVNYSTKNSKGETISRSAVISATYTHPAPVFNTTKQSWLFMKSCDNLEFKFIKEYAGVLKKSKKKNQSKLENKIFEESINWQRNDEAQFRMIFTPWTQERVILEGFEDKKLLDEFKFQKISSFFSNEFSDLSDKVDFNFTFNTFLTNPELELVNLTNNIFSNSKNYVLNRYKSMNYMWTTTLLMSENHSDIIEQEKKEEPIFFQSSCFYILKTILQKRIITGDTETFNLCNYLNEINFNQSKIYIANMTGLSYRKIEKIKYVLTYCSQARTSVNVPVKYYDYIPIKSDLNFCYTFYKTDKYYKKCSNWQKDKPNNCNNKLLNFINELEKNGINVYIENNIIVVENILDEQIVYDIFNEIIQKIDN